MRVVGYPTAANDGATDSADAPRAALSAVLVRTGEKDQRAFQRLYQLTSAKLFGICLRICGERKAAEDVLQEVYLTIWLRAASYKAERGSPITWLATIARNRAIDWQRSQRSGTTAGLDQVAEIADAQPLASERLLFDEADRKLYDCLDTLAGEQRGAIRSAFFDGLTYAQLAERRGIPLATMKSRVRRGLARLRECLDHDA